MSLPEDLPRLVTGVTVKGRKRLLLHKQSAARREPFVLLETEGGEQLRAVRARWDGPTEFIPNPDPDLNPAGWVQTDADVTLI